MKRIKRLIFDKSADNFVGAAELSNEPDFTASKIHCLIIPFKERRRLEHLSNIELKSVWEYAEKITSEKTEANPNNSFAILLNDGYNAGQTIGHLHIHIIGFEENFEFNLEECLNDLLKKYNKSPLTYIDRIKINCKISELGERVIEATKKYQGDDYGISLLSENSFFNASETQDFILQIFYKDNPRSYGLTNLTRVMNGYRDKPTDWPSENKGAIYDLIEQD